FCLRAYLIACFGDMPAVAKLMCMKGHGAKVPCRACRIRGVRDVASTNTKYYAPLARSFANNPDPIRPLDLPRRTHQEYIQQASDVEFSHNDAEEERRATRFGINGLSPLAHLLSIEFPGSFPHDFMHLIFENVIPTLLELWTRSKKYSAFGSGREDYILSKADWESIGAACHASGDTIPSAFGCRVPNLSDNSRRVTAEAKMIFTTLLAPALLHKKLKRAYHRHFMQLVRLINLCLDFKITAEKIEELRKGFTEWVQEYERYV
ncbi:hypothetical protein BDV93DRAFT_426295, partial [Ceratobasidium sp. AG-I]